MTIYAFTSLSPPPNSDTNAYGVNASGEIVGRYSDATGTHSFLDSGGNYTILNDPSAALANSTLAAGIDNAARSLGLTTAAIAPMMVSFTAAAPTPLSRTHRPSGAPTRGASTT